VEERGIFGDWSVVEQNQEQNTTRKTDRQKPKNEVKKLQKRCD